MKGKSEVAFEFGLVKACIPLFGILFQICVVTHIPLALLCILPPALLCTSHACIVMHVPIALFCTHFTSIVIPIHCIDYAHLSRIAMLIHCIVMHLFTCNYHSFSSRVRRVRPSLVKSIWNTFQCSHHSETPGYVPMFLLSFETPGYVPTFLSFRNTGIRPYVSLILKHRDTSLCFSLFG